MYIKWAGNIVATWVHAGNTNWGEGAVQLTSSLTFRDKYFTLFQKLINYDCKKAYNIGP